MDRSYFCKTGLLPRQELLHNPITFLFPILNPGMKRLLGLTHLPAKKKELSYFILF